MTRKTPKRVGQTVNSVCCCAPGRCASEGRWRRIAPCTQPRSGPSRSECETTSSGRSTDCGSGQPVRAFRGIARIPACFDPSRDCDQEPPCGTRRSLVVRYDAPRSNQRREYDFVVGKNGFNCVSWHERSCAVGWRSLQPRRDEDAPSGFHRFCLAIASSRRQRGESEASLAARHAITCPPPGRTPGQLA